MSYRPAPEYDFPWSQLAVLSQALNHASIPKFQWGDHILFHYGADQAVINVGLVVPETDLAKAIAIFVESGLRRCTCKYPGHASEPKTKVDTAAHFFVGKWYKMFLATTDMLSDLIPMTPDDPNPLNLSFLYGQHKLAVEGKHSPPLNFSSEKPKYIPEHHTVRLLDFTSLARVYLYLLGALSESKIKRKGIALPWVAAVNMIAYHIDEDDKLLDTLENADLILYYKRFKRIPLD